MKPSLVLSSVAAIAGIATGAVTNGVTANAATTTGSSTSTTTSQSTTSGQPPVRDESQGGHIFNGKSETLLTGDQLSKATAAAEAKVSGATVLRAETEADGHGTYEVHMQKSDGSRVTVYLDDNFAVTSTEDGPTAPSGQNGSSSTSSSTQTN